MYRLLSFGVQCSNIRDIPVPSMYQMLLDLILRRVKPPDHTVASSLLNQNSSFPSSWPCIPPPPVEDTPILTPSLCNLEIYVRLTAFHPSIYFSIHALRHCCSFPLNELPGLGTQCWKQVEFTCEMSCLAFAMFDCVAMAVISRDFIVLDSLEEPEDEGRGVPEGKVEEGVLGEEEDLSEPPPKKPPKDMVGCCWRGMRVLVERGRTRRAGGCS
jgi:hypothetical protein